MSWYVRTLLSTASNISEVDGNRYLDSGKLNDALEKILGRDLMLVTELLNIPTVVSTETVDEIDYITHESFDFESDDYVNLLLLTKKIKELYQSGNLSKQEVIIISGIMDEDDLYSISNRIGMKDIRPIKKSFHDICNKLAFALGGEFTDEGYLNYIVEKYRLNSEQAQAILEFMEKDRR